MKSRARAPHNRTRYVLTDEARIRERAEARVESAPVTHVTKYQCSLCKATHFGYAAASGCCGGIVGEVKVPL